MRKENQNNIKINKRKFSILYSLYLLLIFSLGANLVIGASSTAYSTDVAMDGYAKVIQSLIFFIFLSLLLYLFKLHGKKESELGYIQYLLELLSSNIGILIPTTLMLFIMGLTYPGYAYMEGNNFILPSIIISLLIMLTLYYSIKIIVSKNSKVLEYKLQLISIIEISTLAAKVSYITFIAYSIFYYFLSEHIPTSNIEITNGMLVAGPTAFLFSLITIVMLILIFLKITIQYFFDIGKFKSKKSYILTVTMFIIYIMLTLEINAMFS